MNLRLIFVLPALLILSGCLRTANRSASEPSSTNGTGSGSSYAANAAKITDACTLMPADLVKKTVPNADAPIRDQILKRCSVSNGTSVLEITLETGVITPTDPVNGAEFVPGLAMGGYLERLDPKDRGDTYLTVILGKDPPGLLHVEVAGHDGKDHKDDAIAVARDILAHLK
ncbi:MAG: hypothetical protein DMF73_14565 [Acidobacteria bacterium]|nr:MAG: hypothetical protein DMF73_14565 [Acidobacteriota bacterium]